MDSVSESNGVDTSAKTLGREVEWGTLDASFHSRRRQLMYVWGPAGIGKTFFVWQFSDYWHSNGHAIVWSSLRQVAPSGLLWWQSLALQFDLEPATATPETLRDAMIARCHIEPFIWVVDDYDSPGIDRVWIVQVALSLASYGGYVIFTGRISPFQLWPRADLHSRLQFLELGEWDAPLIQRILAVAGINDPTVLQHALGLTHGRPQLVSAIVEGMLWLQDNQVPVVHRAFVADATDLSGFLIDQLCHPGSRQLMWNAGRSGDPVDTMLAAAAVVPIFNRDWMTHMVGRSVVTQVWDRFIAMPLVNSYLDGYYGLFAELRKEIQSTVHKMRPWMWEHWVRQAANYYFTQVATGGMAKQYAWGALCEFIRTDLGHPVFAPDLSMSLLQVKHTMTGEASSGAMLVYLTNVVGHRVASATRIVQERHTCRVNNVTVDPQYPDALLDLMTALASTFYLYDEIVWGMPRSEREMRMLQILQFIPQGDEWHLDVSGPRYMSWLASVIAPPRGHRPEDPVRVVQDILQSLREGKEEYGAEARAFWESVAPDGNFRTWFWDALNSAELGERVDGRSLLVLYYLDSMGTHEELAEMVHVSRATYFRNHRTALERLAQAVFD